jgi:hypothetical protein
MKRDHYREVYKTPECPNAMDTEELERIEEGIKDLIAAKEFAGKSWYKVDRTDIPVVRESGKVMSLSDLSPVVGSMKTTGRISLFATKENALAARQRVAEIAKTSKYSEK